LAAIGDLVEQEVRRFARTVTVADVDAWFGRILEELLKLLAAAFGGSRTLGTRYLRQHAALEGLTVEPVLAQWSTEQAMTSLRVTGPVAWKRHFTSTGDEVGATQAMQTTMAAAAQRLALAGSRETVAETIRDSDVIVGWRRVVDADPCAWCAMLASRGVVYRTAESAARVVGRRGVTRGTQLLGQQYHDGDQCTVEPLYEREEEPPEVERLQDLWREVTAGHSGRGAIRQWRRWWDEQRQTQ
jgi:hypothetical protein